MHKTATLLVAIFFACATTRAQELAEIPAEEQQSPQRDLESEVLRLTTAMIALRTQAQASPRRDLVRRDLKRLERRAEAVNRQFHFGQTDPGKLKGEIDASFQEIDRIQQQLRSDAADASPPAQKSKPTPQPTRAAAGVRSPTPLFTPKPARSPGRFSPAELQRALAKRRYYPGPINGRMTPATRRAIGNFQRDNAMQPNGRVSVPLLKKLRVKILPPPPQPRAAARPTPARR